MCLTWWGREEEAGAMMGSSVRSHRGVVLPSWRCCQSKTTCLLLRRIAPRPSGRQAHCGVKFAQEDHSDAQAMWMSLPCQGKVRGWNNAPHAYTLLRGLWCTEYYCMRSPPFLSLSVLLANTLVPSFQPRDSIFRSWSPRDHKIGDPYFGHMDPVKVWTGNWSDEHRTVVYINSLGSWEMGRGRQ